MSYHAVIVGQGENKNIGVGFSREYGALTYSDWVMGYFSDGEEAILYKNNKSIKARIQANGKNLHTSLERWILFITCYFVFHALMENVALLAIRKMTKFLQF